MGSDEWRSATRVVWTQLKIQSAAVQALEPRARDVLWPLFHYDELDLALFDAATMCLLAGDKNKTLYLNERIVTDIYAQASQPAMAVAWFWTHQMVHVTQGLSYTTFRELNTEPDRIETTRADVWADFISLKTLAILDMLENGNSPEGNIGVLRNRELALFNDVVWPMVKMRPNYFIPFERDFEAKRVLSLLVLGVLLESMSECNGNEMVDESVFVNWRTGKTALYIWYGQTGLLGRRSIAVPDNSLELIVAAIKGGRHDEAYDRVRALPLPTGTELEEFCRRSVP